MDYERIDINQCPKGEGNKGPNKFADTARCKKETTEVSDQFRLRTLFKRTPLNAAMLNFSVNQYMVGALDGEVINVDANQVFGCLAL